jgi:hypothetical protein
MGNLPRHALAVLLVCTAVAAAAQERAVNPDAQVLADFKKRVDAYMDVHKRARTEAPRLKPTDNPEDIRAAREALADGIRAARAGAKQGDIFTPDAATIVRRLLTPETTGPDGAQTKKAIEEEAPAAVPLKVNASYPEGKPLPTVPPNVLAALPQLPEELEYRLVHKALILRDVPANLIVDFVPNAIR